MADFWKGMGDAIADIREKTEEALWGRPVTERGEAAEASPQWPQAREEQEPQGMSGDILPPEPAVSHETPSWPRVEHGAVLEGEAQEISRDTPRLGWPEAREAESPGFAERERERNEPDPDIDR